LQPIFKLDGSHPELRELVLETLQVMNRERYPPVFRGPPIVVLAGDLSLAAYLKRASAHYAEARIVQLSNPADARREIEAAGLDPAMLPVGLGGGRQTWRRPASPAATCPRSASCSRARSCYRRRCTSPARTRPGRARE
jgi:hypothetical protein